MPPVSRAIADLLCPRLSASQLRAILAVAGRGGLIGALFGMVHDAVTFSLSAEYFTLLKFPQFEWAEFGWPAFAFAIQIGAIAGGAAGWIAGWFIGRIAPTIADREQTPLRNRAFGIVVGWSTVGFAIGWVVGRIRPPESGLWAEHAARLGASDLTAFSVVADIHLGTYFGAFTGLVIALRCVRRKRLTSPYTKTCG